MSSRDSTAAPLEAGRASLGHVDVLAVGALLAGLVLYVHSALDLGARPEEDAAMLLRYSEHLARGHGIVWNQGEAPVDGATDFLFMVLVALLHRLGLGLETAARSIGLVAHALTVIGIYLGPRVLFGCAPPLAFLGGAFLAVGPGLRHLAASYGTPLFALWALVAFLVAARLALTVDHALARPARLFALASLGLGLARPEGVFLGGFLLLSVLVARRGEGLGVIAGWYLGVLLTLGLAYFVWRWHYFGYPLPNPFYKKGGGVLHLHSLRKAWEDLWTLSLPFSLVVLAGLLAPRARRWAAFTAIPVALFVALWVLISNETNYVARFRYPVLPLILVGWVPVAQALGRRHPWWRRLRGGAGWIACLAVSATLVGWQHQRYREITPRPMGLHEAAVMLSGYADRNFTLATTEAGLLPFYSGWRAVDAWGLNDAFIAHRGGITEEYLDRYRPELIVFHAFFSPDTPQDGPRVENRSLGPAWYRMVMTLKRYAEARDYVLAAVYGLNDRDTHWYYVRAGFPQSAEIVHRIRALHYAWDGQPTIDFAAGERQTVPESAEEPPRGLDAPSRQ
ncbi:MAG: hypothetical protein LJF30_24000 [Acidobacteria bacterium]|jgi:hypothetical protein|nr:hypothetical protein [Acidobacteriota bacterium]